MEHKCQKHNNAKISVFHCEESGSILPRAAKFTVGWSPKMPKRRFAAGRGKKKTANISISETAGHPNMSSLQTFLS
jgi:hypothetical protein